jgi:hypothetical protein
MEPQYITKEYSIAVINHAIASAKFMEEKQSDIAELLGVDKSNIPKYKSGRQKLSPTGVKLLIDRYGMPRQAKGEYLEATLYKTVDEYLHAMDERLNDHYCAAFANIFSKSDVIKAIASTVSAKPLKNIDSDEPFSNLMFSQQGCKKHEIPHIIEWVNNAIKSDSFRTWYEAMIDHVKHKSTQSSYLKPTPPSLDGEWSDTLINRDDFPLFFLLADFYFNHPTQYSLPFQGVFESKHFSTEPLVLTGEQILHSTSKHVPFVRREAHTFLQNSFNFFREQDIGGLYISSDLNALDDLKPSSFDFFLFMNKDMVYRLLINEFWGTKRFDIVITDIPQQEIFLVFEKLRDKFGFDRETEVELRAKIAKAGGFIPGARVL